MINKKGEIYWHDFIPLFFIIIIILMVGVAIWCNWIASGRQCRLYNEKFGTNYQQADCFFCQNTIQSFLNGGEQKTQNINLNGAIPIKVVEEDNDK
jgi:hypothetical protein